MTEQVYTAKEPTAATPPSPEPPSGWPDGWTYPGPPWPPGWTPLPFFRVEFSVASVALDTAVTLTLTAYTAAGAVDTDYAETVDVTDDSATLSILTAAGAAFIGFVAGDFTAGVATASVKFHDALGALAADEDVEVAAVENGALSPAGVGNITVLADLGAYWLE